MNKKNGVQRPITSDRRSVKLISFKTLLANLTLGYAEFSPRRENSASGEHSHNKGKEGSR